MIKGQCRTNWDEGKRRNWPDAFVDVPLVGSTMRAEDGYELVVVRIVHYMVIPRNDPNRSYPAIEVELNKPHYG